MTFFTRFFFSSNVTVAGSIVGVSFDVVPFDQSFDFSFYGRRLSFESFTELLDGLCYKVVVGYDLSGFHDSDNCCFYLVSSVFFNL